MLFLGNSKEQFDEGQGVEGCVQCYFIYESEEYIYMFGFVILTIHMLPEISFKLGSVDWYVSELGDTVSESDISNTTNCNNVQHSWQYMWPTMGFHSCAHDSLSVRHSTDTWRVEKDI